MLRRGYGKTTTCGSQRGRGPDLEAISIDTRTESQIREAIRRIMAGRTALVIAHRLSTIQAADKILVMHKGEIRESGDHRSLLARRGIYWRLYQLQFCLDPKPIAVEIMSDD